MQHIVLQIIHASILACAVVLYAKATYIIMRNFNSITDVISPFRRKGWVAIFVNVDDDKMVLSPYILRLVLLSAVMMLFLNVWHLFTYSNEEMPDVKNIAWRLAHILVASLLVLTAKFFRRWAKDNGSTK